MRWEQENAQKVKDFQAKMKQGYEFKKAYAARRAWEFYNHPEVAGKCYVAVGGLDSITLFIFLHSIGINIPATSVSMLEDRSIQEYYTFPPPEALTDAADLAGLGLGYRDKYMAAMARTFTGGLLDVPYVSAMDYARAKAILKAIPGIGEKVANCILLYGMGHLEAFPVDTWIRRVLDREFPDGFPMERYAGFAGLVQQMIFYYERRK